MNQNYKIGDVLDVTIEKIVPRGLGIAFVEDATVFVSLSAPGDRLRVRIARVKKNTLFANVLDIISASPLRTEPACEYYGKCGGCDMQHIKYDAQLAAKAEIVRDCLVRLGKVDADPEIEMISSPLPFAYRSRARWQLDRKSQRIGYFRKESHSVIDVTACPIITPGLDSGFQFLRNSIDWAAVSSDPSEVDAASDGQRISLFSKARTEPTAELSVTIGGFTYQYSAETFFQANRSMIERLIDAAVGGYSGKNALDLYCGVGLFSVPLAGHFSRVTAVEENRSAAKFAKSNVVSSGQENVKVVNKSVERYMADSTFGPLDLIVLDPPRSGVANGVIESVIKARPANISYISCEPSILARDLRVLLDAGYTIEKVTALDMFPQTHHIETVIRLRAN